MKLIKNTILLTAPQITYFKQFDSEELEYRGEVQKKNNSFDHAFGTKYEYDWFITDLEARLAGKWVVLVEKGEFGDSIWPFEQDQIEEIINCLKD